MKHLFPALACVLVVASGAAYSQGSESPPSFFEVPQYDQPFAGWAEARLFSTRVNASDQPYEQFGLASTREGLIANSGELEYGVTDRFTIGAYLDLERPPDRAMHHTQTRLLARYRFANRHDLAINPALYFEYYIPYGGYAGEQKLETRFIIDRDVGDFRFVADPGLSVTTAGPERSGNPSLGLAAGIYWRRHFNVQPALEYYAQYGQVRGPGAKTEYVIPGFTIHLTPHLIYHLGVALGLTDASDDRVIVAEVRIEAPIFSPTTLFGRTLAER